MGFHVKFEGRCEWEEDQAQQVADELHCGHHVGGLVVVSLLWWSRVPTCPGGLR